MVTALLVEDDPAILSLLGKYLAKRGVAVTACDSAASAIAEAGMRRFDAAVIDVTLPDGDGLEVARRIHAISAPAILIVCSGYPVSEGDVGLPRGTFAILQKPFLPSQLWMLIESAVISSSEV